MPSEVVDVNSWTSPACYPRGSFCLISHGPSTQYRGITKPDFRLCSTRWSCSQAPLCLYTLWQVSILPEGTFGRLRYSLGGDRPSQTAHQALSPRRMTAGGENQNQKRVVFHRPLHVAHKRRFSGSHLSYASLTQAPCQATVKLHGVFLSSRG